MLKDILSNLLNKIIDDINTGNCNISDDETLEIISYLKNVTSPYMSKYQACEYLNMSRAKFDNLIRGNKLPKGIKKRGFSELFWDRYNLDIAINKLNNNGKDKSTKR